MPGHKNDKKVTCTYHLDRPLSTHQCHGTQKWQRLAWSCGDTSPSLFGSSSTGTALLLTCVPAYKWVFVCTYAQALYIYICTRGCWECSHVRRARLCAGRLGGTSQEPRWDSSVAALLLCRRRCCLVVPAGTGIAGMHWWAHVLIQSRRSKCLCCEMQNKPWSAETMLSV